jgi:hypothetical protein
LQYADEMRFELKLTSKCGPAQVYLLNNNNGSGSNSNSKEDGGGRSGGTRESIRGRTRNASQQQQQQSAYGNVGDEPGDILEGDGQQEEPTAPAQGISL